MRAAAFKSIILGAIAPGFFCMMPSLQAGAQEKLPEIRTAAPASGDPFGIRWLEFDYDFGLMKEEAGPKTGVSRFVNEGEVPVTIVSVRPSCGCTSAVYTEDPVAPGDTATISYTYDPTRRPGKFEKSVKVRLDNGARYSIGISGNVLGTPESLTQLYPVEAGKLRLNRGRVDFGDIQSGTTRSSFVSAYNLSPDSIAPSAKSASDALAVTRDSGRIGPGDIATFGVYFDAAKHGRLGPVEIPVEIYAEEGDPQQGEATVTVTATVLPAPFHLTPERERKAPMMFVEPDPVDLGGIARGADPEFEITVTHRGKDRLEIGAVYDKAGRVEVLSLPKPLKGGKSGRIKCRLKSGLMPGGPFRIPLTILSNDPRGGGVAQTSVCGMIE